MIAHLLKSTWHNVKLFMMCVCGWVCIAWNSAMGVVLKQLSM